MFARYAEAHPELAATLELMRDGELPSGWDAELPHFDPDPKGLATRESSAKVLNAIAPHYPWLVGGAGDLGVSTKTELKGAGDFEAGARGRNLHFGIREHAMGAALNGLALSKLRPFGATFLIFSDYMKPAIRLANLMLLPVIYLFTHDSIGLGEDGPTHQPVEQLITLRAIPGQLTLRPADANEVVEAWRVMITSKRPVALVLSRQALPTLDRDRFAAATGVAKGGYILSEAPRGEPDVILIGTGSELAPCLSAQELLTRGGVAARVVSLPSWELFDEQEQAYREQVLHPRSAPGSRLKLGQPGGGSATSALKGP